MASMSDTQQTVVDPETFTVRRSIDIAAPVEKVWTAVTDPGHISQWFGQAAFDGAGVGSVGTLTWPGEHPTPVRIESIDEPRSVSYRWNNSGTAATTVDDGPSTVFTFTLEPVPSGTRLTVVETGFEAVADPAATMESHRTGWDAELDKLVALVQAD